MQLQPQEYFTVVRQLHDWNDTDTNYVQAVIRNARTDELLATLELNDKGNRRFSKEWQVKADTSGLGYYITITTSVFIDSDYSSKNPNYGDEMNTYLVDERKRIQGGGGGSDIDYKKIASIVKENNEETAINLLGEMLPKLATIDYPRLLDAINAIPSKIEIPPQQPITIPDYTKNLEAINGHIKALQASIEAIRGNMPNINLTPLETQIQELQEVFNTSIEDINESMEDYSQAILDKVDTLSGIETVETEDELTKTAKSLRS